MFLSIKQYFKADYLQLLTSLTTESFQHTLNLIPEIKDSK